jgi:hypothetical protein
MDFRHSMPVCSRRKVASGILKYFPKRIDIFTGLISNWLRASEGIDDISESHPKKRNQAFAYSAGRLSLPSRPKSRPAFSIEEQPSHFSVQPNGNSEYFFNDQPIPAQERI